jgi:hypothetical protein
MYWMAGITIKSRSFLPFLLSSRADRGHVLSGLRHTRKKTRLDRDRDRRVLSSVVSIKLSF